MIAAISNTGTMRFRVFDERFTGPLFLDFLKRLVKDNDGRKTMLTYGAFYARKQHDVDDANRPRVHPDISPDADADIRWATRNLPPTAAGNGA